MAQYLLDGDIISDLIKNPQGKVFQRIALVGEDQICTSIIVAAELHYGAEKKGSSQLIYRVSSILSTIPVIPYEPPAHIAYGRNRALLEKGGNIIGGNDLLIASQAQALGLVMVTHNTREYKRIKGLIIEDWLV